MKFHMLCSYRPSEGNNPYIYTVGFIIDYCIILCYVYLITKWNVKLGNVKLIILTLKCKITLTLESDRNLRNIALMLGGKGTIGRN